jgi:hypothetical protein
MADTKKSEPKNMYEAYGTGYEQGYRDAVKLITDTVSFKCTGVETVDDAINLPTQLMEWMEELRKQNKVG